MGSPIAYSRGGDTIARIPRGIKPSSLKKKLAIENTMLIGDFDE